MSGHAVQEFIYDNQIGQIDIIVHFHSNRIKLLRSSSARRDESWHYFPVLHNCKVPARRLRVREVEIVYASPAGAYKVLISSFKLSQKNKVMN